MTETIFYDGRCGLCHRAVLFVLKRDERGDLFRFAPLGDPTAQSIVVRTVDGRLLERSEAALHILGRLGGGWRALATAMRIGPRPLRDWAYDRIAAVRHRLFRRPPDACPVVEEELRSRFDLPQ